MLFKFLLLFYMLLNTCRSTKAPVLIWGLERGDLKPSLNVVSNKDFSDLLEKELENSMVVVFLENGLSVEDLSRCQIDSVSCYTKIAEITPRTYYTNVDYPISALRDVANEKEYMEISASGKINQPIKYNTGKVLFLNFEDNRSDIRENLLHDHDSQIIKIYQELSKLGKIVAVYTSSAQGPNSRRIRQAEQQPEKNYTFFPEQRFLIYFTSIKIVSENPEVNLDVTNAELKESDGKIYDIKLITNKANVELQIKFSGDGYWSLVGFKYNNEIILANISVPQGFSYSCGIPTEYTTVNKTTLLWKGLQMQAFPEVQEKAIFGDPWHCVGFTSAGIWSGLFVTFMLLAILSVGISWLMDIKTMDRFDDPKGKTITINATD